MEDSFRLSFSAAFDDMTDYFANSDQPLTNDYQKEGFSADTSSKFEDKVTEMKKQEEEDKLNPKIDVSQYSRDDNVFIMQKNCFGEKLKKFDFYNDRQFYGTIEEQGKKFVVCKICGKTFKQVAAFHTHMANCHNGDKPFMCALCGHRSVRLGNLNIHIQRHATREGQVFKQKICQICGKCFLTQYELTRHVRTHLNVAQDHNNENAEQ